MTGSRIFAALVLLAAALAMSGCGRKSGLDTPYEAQVQARKDAEEPASRCRLSPRRRTRTSRSFSTRCFRQSLLYQSRSGNRRCLSLPCRINRVLYPPRGGGSVEQTSRSEGCEPTVGVKTYLTPARASPLCGSNPPHKGRVSHEPFRISRRRAACRGRGRAGDRGGGRHAVLLLFDGDADPPLHRLRKSLRGARCAGLLRPEGEFEPGGAACAGEARRRRRRGVGRRDAARAGRRHPGKQDPVLRRRQDRARDGLRPLGGHPLLQRRIRTRA